MTTEKQRPHHLTTWRDESIPFMSMARWLQGHSRAGAVVTSVASSG